RTEPGPADKSGRPIPLAVEGSEFTVACTAVIAAFGEVCDVSFLPSETRCAEDGHILVDPETYETKINGLYAVGEMTGKEGTAAAFHAGFACADVIHIRLGR